MADPLRSSIWLRDSDRSVISEPANLAGYRRLRQRWPGRPARWVSSAGVWSARHSCGRRAPVAVLIGHSSYDIVTRLIANFCSVVGVDARRVAWLSLPPAPERPMRPLHIPDSQTRLDHHYAIVPSNCLCHGGALTRGRGLRRRQRRYGPDNVAPTANFEPPACTQLSCHFHRQQHRLGRLDRLAFLDLRERNAGDLHQPEPHCRLLRGCRHLRRHPDASPTTKARPMTTSVRSP